MPEPIQLTRSGAVVNASPHEIQDLQQQFAEHHCILLPRLIEPFIMGIVAEQVSKARFVPREHKGVGLESWIPNDASVGTLRFMMNTPEFLRFIEHVTSIGPVGGFDGRIYRMAVGEGHYDSWHNDMAAEIRLLTLSLNLSREAYEGGELEIRDVNSKQTLFRIANTGFGDAIVFRISHQLEHRVAPVLGTAPKTAYAGWFGPSPADFLVGVRSGIAVSAADAPKSS